MRVTSVGVSVPSSNVPRITSNDTDVRFASQANGKLLSKMQTKWLNLGSGTVIFLTSCLNIFNLSQVRVTDRELFALIPLASLGGVYWLRDKYAYNRAEEKTTVTQWKVLFGMYPVAIFLEWMAGLSTSRGRSFYLFTSGVGRSLAWHYTHIPIINDSFTHTVQQFKSIFISIVIIYVWAVFGILVFSS